MFYLTTLPVAKLYSVDGRLTTDDCRPWKNDTDGGTAHTRSNICPVTLGPPQTSPGRFSLWETGNKRPL